MTERVTTFTSGDYVRFPSGKKLYVVSGIPRWRGMCPPYHWLRPANGRGPMLLVSAEILVKTDAPREQGHA